MSSAGSAADVQTAIKDDFDNREFTDKMSLGIRQMVEFLNRFDLQARYLMSQLDERLSATERKLAVIEARLVTVVPSSTTTTSTTTENV